MGRNAAAFASAASMTRLVAVLSRRLESEADKHPDLIPPSPLRTDGERVVEACVQGRENVVATMGRLLVRSVKSGGEIIAIPYEKITKIARHIKAPWPLLAGRRRRDITANPAGILGLGLISSSLGPPVMAAFSAIGRPEFVSGLIAFTPPLPFLASATAFILMLREGFLIYYGRAGAHSSCQGVSQKL